MRPGPEPASPRRVARAARAWLAVAVWIGVVLGLGSRSFGASATSAVLLPLLHWLAPHLSGRELVTLAMALRKVAHPTVYGVLALLSLRAWRLTLPIDAGRAALLACGMALTVAAVDESRQLAEPGRTGSLWDVALDGAGAAAAAGGSLLVGRARRERRRRLP